MKSFLTLLSMIACGVAIGADNREDIEIVFDRNKGGLYALYGRELRENPKLEGKIVFDIEIAKTGDVTACRVRSSQMGDSDLPQKLCDRIQGWKFKPRSSPITITKPVDFFRAG